MTPSGRPYSIRPSHDGDAPDLAALIEAVTGEGELIAAVPGEPDTIEQSSRLVSIVLEGGLSLTLEVDGVPAGHVMVQRRAGKHYAHVGEVAIIVSNAQRGIGLGRSLMEMAIDWGRAVGLAKLSLRVFPDNGRAIALYRFARVRGRRPAPGRGAHAEWGQGHAAHGPLPVGTWRDSPPCYPADRMSDSRPIGVFDSGVGGLTVLREIRHQMPAEGLVYVADLEHFPYGPRSQREVRGLALDIIAMLVGMDTKLVVIACNTATAAALHVARERFDIPVVGVIAPGAQAAAAATRNGRVAVLSTEGTRASGEYVHAIKEANPGIHVLSEVAPELVEIVEDGDADTPRAEAALLPVLERVFAWRVDTLVLGCTHYPLLRPALRRLIGSRRLRVVDSADTTASRVSRIVDVNRIGAGVPAGSDPASTAARTELLVTAAPARFTASAARLFTEPLPNPSLVRPVPQAFRLAAGS